MPCQALHLLQALQQQKGIPGIQIAVSVKGQTILSQGLGYADVANQLPVTTSTQFRIGSISKSLTSAALLKLLEEQRLDLDAPIQRYVPTFPRKPYPITTRQLAGHLAGIRHYNLDDPHDANRTEHYQTVTQALAIFQQDPLLFEPGTQYHYSSYGWNLIGAVIEGIVGQAYLPYMQRTIWLPLGMVHTYGDQVDSIMPDRSKFYQNNGKLIPPDDMSSKYPSGGILSTADDLVLYGNSLLVNTLFKPKLTRLLFASQTTRAGRSVHYGLGWHVGLTASGHRVYWHDGLVAGGSGYLLLYPDDKIVVSILANSRLGHDLPAQALGELFLANY
ncbi:MAG: serine hydrolase domain-containing protein [Janthinobacterium lividum]